MRNQLGTDPFNSRQIVPKLRSEIRPNRPEEILAAKRMFVDRDCADLLPMLGIS